MYVLVMRPSLSGKPHTLVGMHEKLQGHETFYAVDHLERIEGGLVFSQVLQRVQDVLQLARGRYREARILLDMEEADRSIWSVFRSKGVPAIAIYVDKAPENFGVKISRTELLSVVYLQIGEGKLRWAKNLELSIEFREQLRGFRLKPEKEYLDGRVVLDQGGTEDLIRCVAIGLWYAERYQRRTDPAHRPNERSYDPLRA